MNSTLCFTGLWLLQPQIPSRLFIESAHAAYREEKKVRVLSNVEKQFLQAHGLTSLNDVQIKFDYLHKNPPAHNLILIYIKSFDVL